MRATAETCSVEAGRTTATGRASVLDVDHSEWPCSSRSPSSVLTASSPIALRISATAWQPDVQTVGDQRRELQASQARTWSVVCLSAYLREDLATRDSVVLHLGGGTSAATPSCSTGRLTAATTPAAAAPPSATPTAR